MIDHDNLEEYRDAEIYDAMNGGFEIGGRFYLDLALECGNPILELACGTGRLTIPLAEQGFNITGVDITPERINPAYLDIPSILSHFRYISYQAFLPVVGH
jgi:2-polyprenyl-3-methyl-5-hydroxy-6-metoxy-1,4-benzoquinol methylase